MYRVLGLAMTFDFFIKLGLTCHAKYSLNSRIHELLVPAICGPRKSVFIRRSSNNAIS